MKFSENLQLNTNENEVWLKYSFEPPFPQNESAIFPIIF